MTSPLLPTLSKLVDEEWIRLERNQITPWAFMTAGPPFRVQDFYGKQIAYQGIEFEGSPRDVYWGRYIEPFLEDIVQCLIQRTTELANKKRETAKGPLNELRDLLKVLVRRTYKRMADIDQQLRGKGFPTTVNRRPVEREVGSMNRFIDQHIDAELTMVRPSRPVKDFYYDHPVLFWLIPILVGVAITILAA